MQGALQRLLADGTYCVGEGPTGDCSNLIEHNDRTAQARASVGWPRNTIERGVILLCLRKNRMTT